MYYLFVVKYSELLRLLKQNGWFVKKQTGSHILMGHPIKTNQIVLPFHGSKEVKTGTLKKILKDAQIRTSKG